MLNKESNDERITEKEIGKFNIFYGTILIAETEPAHHSEKIF